eukprot:5477421-Pyramimonas_sp.AAC.1
MDAMRSMTQIMEANITASIDSNSAAVKSRIGPGRKGCQHPEHPQRPPGVDPDPRAAAADRGQQPDQRHRLREWSQLGSI